MEKSSLQPPENAATGRRGQKRKRRRSSEVNAVKVCAGAGEGEGGVSEGKGKRPRLRQQSVSSKTVANHVMKTRVLGSESDPLNLEGVSGVREVEECSTCAPSPVFRDGGQPSPLPLHLLCDPLNLEGRVREHSGPSRPGDRPGGNRKKHGGRRRTISHTEEGKEGAGGGRGRAGRGGRAGGGGGGGKRSHGKKKRTSSSVSNATSGPAFQPPAFKQQDQRYCYGNYDMYYGYRCGGSGAVEVADPRMALMRREWFEGKECLDIGSNTGQITLTIAQRFSPKRIVGVDIDHKLVRIANKNLFRHHVPLVAPDGRAFPSSFTSKGSFPLLTKSRGHSQHPNTTTAPTFPHNIEFIQENYVPDSEEGVASTHVQYDVILALSITKWVHLNWGDDGLRRMFRKMFQHLRPGGRLILEPQPFGSYARKKKLTPAIYKNYYAIKFLPDQFHKFLMSPEVGFSAHQFLGVPPHKSAGFRRPLHMYIKSETKQSGGSERGGGGEREVGEKGGEEAEAERGGESMQTEAAAAVVTGGEGGGGRRDEGQREMMEHNTSSSQCDSVDKECLPSCVDRTSGE